MDFQNTISFLDSHNGAITAIATVVLAIITGLYLIETHKQNSIAVRPYPKLDLRFENVEDEEGHLKRFLILYVENIGRGPLMDIKVRMIEPYEEHFEKKIVFPVGEKTRIQLSEEEKYQKHKKFKINIKYKDMYDKEYQNDFNLEATINIRM